MATPHVDFVVFYAHVTFCATDKPELTFGILQIILKEGFPIRHGSKSIHELVLRFKKGCFNSCKY